MTTCRRCEREIEPGTKHVRDDWHTCRIVKEVPPSLEVLDAEIDARTLSPEAAERAKFALRVIRGENND